MMVGCTIAGTSYADLSFLAKTIPPCCGCIYLVWRDER
jgi:hypothetical protein